MHVPRLVRDFKPNHFVPLKFKTPSETEVIDLNSPSKSNDSSACSEYTDVGAPPREFTDSFSVANGHTMNTEKELLSPNQNDAPRKFNDPEISVCVLDTNHINSSLESGSDYDDTCNEKEILHLHKYYACLKLDNRYRKCVSWLSNGGNTNIAIVEYIGSYPG